MRALDSVGVHFFGRGKEFDDNHVTVRDLLHLVQERLELSETVQRERLLYDPGKLNLGFFECQAGGVVSACLLEGLIQVHQLL